MKVFIPSITSKFKLTQDWTFRLFIEYRNNKLLDRMGFDNNRLCQLFNVTSSYYVPSDKFIVVTFPAGIELSVDRVYIKRGQQAFDSVTFRVKFPDIKGGFRFWAKLSDVNKIEADLLNPPVVASYNDSMSIVFPK